MTIVAPSDVFQGTAFRDSGDVQRLSRERARADLLRQNQLAQLEGALQQQFDAADETARTLRTAGLADVANRFERASRRQAFNNARRGLIGGSVDLEQRAEQQEMAAQEARNVEQQAQQSAIEQKAKAQQSRDALLKQALSADPLQLRANLAQIRGIGDEARAQAQVGGIQNRIQASRNQQQGVLGNVIGGALGGAGTGLSAALIAGA